MKNYLKLIRVNQWVKNLFVLAPLFFAGKFSQPDFVITALIGFFCFCLFSSAVYIINDIKDINLDRNHFKKKNRPLASGKIKMLTAIIIMQIFLILGVFIQINYLPKNSLIVILIYFIINIFYSLILKNIAILDVLIIASGFVLRVIYGAYILNVHASSWIISTTFCLAMFLGFAKRFHEFNLENPSQIRVSLNYYSSGLLDRLISISCGATIISYLLYTVEVSNNLNKPEFIFTTFFVIYGLLKFLQNIYVNKMGDDPIQVLIKDKIFTINIFFWLFSSIYILFLAN